MVMIGLCIAIDLFAMMVTPLPTRRFLQARWREVEIVAPSLDSELLLHPQLVVASRERVYVFDYGDMTIKAFRMDGGGLAWSFGREGHGPGEFSNPTDLRLDDTGRIWLLDPANKRVTIVTDGKLVEEIPLSRPAMRLAVTPDGAHVFGVGSTSKDYAFRLENGGRLGRPVVMPAWLNSLPSMANDVRIVGLPGRNGIASGFVSTGVILLHRSGAPRADSVSAVEVLPVPKVITYSPRPGVVVNRLPPDVTTAVKSIAADSTFLYVLFGGKGASASRIVDLYDIATTRYVGSYMLPRRTTQIAVTPQGIVTLETSDIPGIVLLIPDRRPVRPSR